MKSAKKVIGIIGSPGVGKDTVAALIAEITGKKTEKFSFSKILIEEYCAHLGIAPTHPNLQYVGDAIRPEWLHDRAKKYIEDSSAEIIIIPSIRRLADYQFVESFADHMLLCVVTDERKAYERMKERKEKPGEEHLTWEAYQVLKSAAIDAEIPALLKKASTILQNDGSLEDLTEHIRSLFSHE